MANFKKIATMSTSQLAKIERLSISASFWTGCSLISHELSGIASGHIGILLFFSSLIVILINSFFSKAKHRAKTYFRIGFILLIFSIPLSGYFQHLRLLVSIAFLSLILLLIGIAIFLFNVIIAIARKRKANLNFRFLVFSIAIPSTILLQLTISLVAWLIPDFFKLISVLSLLLLGLLAKCFVSIENSRSTCPIAEDEIKGRAYQLWQSDRYKFDQDDEYWHEAKKQIRDDLSFWKLAQNRFLKLLRSFSRAWEPIGIIMIPIVILFATLIDNYRRDYRESATRGQDAVKNYLDQVIEISVSNELNENNRSKQLLREVTLAFWEDPNVTDDHRRQVVETLISLELVQSYDHQEAVISLEDFELDSIDFRDADLRGTNLQGASLHNADLRNTNLSGANLSGANLSDADLTGANLSDAILDKAVFSKARLGPIDFNGMKLTSVEFEGAKLEGADFRDAVLHNVDFSNADLFGTSFVGAEVSGISFSGADLAESKLRDTKTDLAYVDFTGAVLTNAELNGICLIGAKLIDAKLNGANLTGAIFGKSEVDCIDENESEDTLPISTSQPVDEDAPRKRPIIGTFTLPQMAPSSADINRADFSGAEGLSIQQIKAAENWESATYDSDFRRQLKL